MKKKNHITIRDVATLAKVSPATVSHVINNTGLIGEDTTKRVERAMETLNYQPNFVARGLRSQKTATIGLILSNIANSFYPSVARGAEDAANKQGYNIIFCNTDENPEKERRYVDELISRQVDGYLIVPADKSQTNLEKLQQINRPFVYVDRILPEFPADAVLLDNYQGALDACTHFITHHGCRRIGTISGPLGLTTGRERMDGYRASLDAGQLPYQEKYVREGDFTEESGYHLAGELLRDNPELEALFLANNLMCLGALKRMKELGVRPGHDLAILCFDEMPWAALIDPPLTTISYPACRLGEVAATILIERLKGDSSAIKLERVPTELIVRHSCGCGTSCEGGKQSHGHQM